MILKRKELLESVIRSNEDIMNQLLMDNYSISAHDLPCEKKEEWQRLEDLNKLLTEQLQQERQKGFDRSLTLPS